MTAYYNDNDPYVAQWLRNLIAAGLLPPGDVDGRGIHEVQPDDLRGYTQVHLFAGIGGWPLALSLAGWPASAPVWTGSCPCQPYSGAGKGAGDSDTRNLWPEFRRLVADCQPSVVFGEQVASHLGRAWLAGVRADLEDLGYAVGAADLCAAGLGAPHIRQRLFWVADAQGQRRNGRKGAAEQTGWDGLEISGGLDNATGDGAGRTAEAEPSSDGSHDRVPGAAGARRGPRWLENADDAGLPSSRAAYERLPEPDTSSASSPWDNSALVYCTDGKARRIEPGLPPLAHGVPARVGKLRAYGNAIVPQVAAAFIRAYLEAQRP